MADIKALESWREEQELKKAASVFERRANESLQRLKMASNGLDGEKASRIWEAVANALELAEMALERG